MNAVVAFAGGVVLGALITIVVFLGRKKDSEALAQESVEKAENRKSQDLDKLLGQVKESLQSLSLDAMGKSNEALVRLAEEKLGSRAAQGEKELDKKKELIDQNVETLRADVKRMQDLVATLERDRQQKFGELTQQLRAGCRADRAAPGHRGALAASPGFNQVPRPVGRADGRGRPDPGRIQGGLQLPQTEGHGCGGEPAGLHFSPAPGASAQHGRQVSPGQLPPVSGGR